MPAPAQAAWIADLPAWEKVLPDLASAETFALDTETNGLHAYRSQICILQIMAGGNVYLLDILRLGLPEGLGDLLKDRSKRKILHGASHDIASLKEDFSCPLRGIFDTYVAATFLGLAKVSLADLLLELYQVPHDKAWQKKDWTIRPLPEAALEYLARDVLYLPDLARDLAAKAEEAGILEEIEIECARVEETQATGTAFDPIGYLWMKGTEEFTPEEMGVLREVWLERDRWAKQLDRPSFKVLPDGILQAMAKSSARNPSALKHYRPFQSGRPASWGNEVSRAREDFYKAIERGRDHEGIPQEDLDEADRRDKAREEQEYDERRGPRGRRVRFEALKAFRREEAEKRKVTPIVVLPNWGIQDLASDPPRNLEELYSRGLGRSRVVRYGETILEILRKSDTREKSSPAK